MITELLNDAILRRLNILENEVRNLKHRNEPYQPIAPIQPIVTLTDEQSNQIKKALENH